jgi:hypothetical protein
VKTLNINIVGRWAFITFVILAILTGIAAGFGGKTTLGWVTLAMVILGIIVGFTTLTERETQPFLIAAIALLVANASDAFLVIDEIAKPLGTIIDAILRNVAVFVAPPAMIMALKAVFHLAKD